MTTELIHRELTESIIGCAMTVLNTLRPGLDEKLYENALVIELRQRGHKVDQQTRYPVRYSGQLIGTLVPDLVVDEAAIVDAKVVAAFNDEHVAQMLGYLNITSLRVALLLNFKYRELRWKRVVL
jgi:GxxExxY protein